MKVTSRETYKVVRGVLELREFTQSELSRKEKVTFSLVNRVVNWLVSRGYVARRKNGYALVAAAGVFNLFPIYRQMVPWKMFEVDARPKHVLELLEGKATLCLSSALPYYDDYFRDPAIYAYADDEKLAVELAQLRKGFTRVELYRNDLDAGDSVVKNGLRVTGKVRTVVDLFCANKAYAAERLVKREWG